MKIESNGIQDFFEKPQSKQTGSARALSNQDADASLRVNYAFIMDKAKQIPPPDTKSVQQARELLLSGRLESPQNIRKASENIIRFGI